MSRLSDIMNDDESSGFKKKGYSAPSSSMMPTHHHHHQNHQSSSSSLVSGFKPEPHTGYYSEPYNYSHSSTLSSPAANYNRTLSVGSSHSSSLHPSHSHPPHPENMDSYPTDLSHMGQMSGHNMRYVHPQDPAAGQVKYTPVTGRVSRAKKGIPVHTCSLCNKTFTRAEHLRRHQLSHGRPEFRCPAPGCEREFHRKDLLDRHQQRHETEGINGTNDSISYTSTTQHLMTAMSQESLHLRPAGVSRPAPVHHQFDQHSSHRHHSYMQHGADQQLLHSRGSTLRLGPIITPSATIPINPMYHNASSTSCSPPVALGNQQHDNLSVPDYNGYGMDQAFNPLVTATCDTYATGIMTEAPRNMDMQFSQSAHETMPTTGWNIASPTQEGTYMDQVMSSPTHYQLHAQTGTMPNIGMDNEYAMLYNENQNVPFERQYSNMSYHPGISS